MKGVRFYEEFVNKHKTVSAGNVVAVLFANGFQRGSAYPFYDGICAPLFGSNASPSSASVSVAYLRSYCKRVSEKRAREIHPRLFVMLDD
jgi:hypothetical protein